MFERCIREMNNIVEFRKSMCNSDHCNNGIHEWYLFFKERTGRKEWKRLIRGKIRVTGRVLRTWQPFTNGWNRATCRELYKTRPRDSCRTKFRNKISNNNNRKIFNNNNNNNNNTVETVFSYIFIESIIETSNFAYSYLQLSICIILIRIFLYFVS